ncbi:MAG TPA: Uma2 family endonuclease [Rubrobacter sp.]
MAKQTTAHDSLTVEEYLKLEESATVRLEYVGGEIFAMVGATKRHNRIIGNIFSHLWGVARGGACKVYSKSVKLRVADDVIYYPWLPAVLKETTRSSKTLLVWQ